MSRLVLLIDLERCIGCLACGVACKQENGVPTGVNRNEVQQVGPLGEYPNLRGCFLPRLCVHCKDPACIKVCRVKACYRRGDGLVLTDHELCTLCERCVRACPYDARSYNSRDMKIESCNMCLHRIDAGDVPACVASCAGQALVFGDTADPQGKVSRYLLANRDRVVLWPDDEATNAKVVYLAPKGWDELEIKAVLGKKRHNGVALKRTVGPIAGELVGVTLVRGHTYRLLARVWRAEVDTVLLYEFSNTPFPALPEIPELDGAYKQLKKTLHGNNSEMLRDLGSDYATLCLGVDPLLGADPYESVHRSRAGLLMQEEWEQVLHLYAKVGLKRSADTTEPEDHLAMELECMAHLCEQMAIALTADKNQEARWAFEQQKIFLNEHLMQWAPSFSAKVLESAQTDFYKAFAVITRELLRLDHSLVNSLHVVF